MSKFKVGDEVIFQDKSLPIRKKVRLLITKAIKRKEFDTSLNPITKFYYETSLIDTHLSEYWWFGFWWSEDYPSIPEEKLKKAKPRSWFEKFIDIDFHRTEE